MENISRTLYVRGFYGRLIIPGHICCVDHQDLTNLTFSRNGRADWTIGYNDLDPDMPVIYLHGDRKGCAVNYYRDTIDSIYNLLIGGSCVPEVIDDVEKSMVDEALAILGSEIEMAALRIQRQFRLWQWRMRVYFNPHTEIGQMSLEIRYRVLLKSV